MNIRNLSRNCIQQNKFAPVSQTLPSNQTVMVRYILKQSALHTVIFHCRKIYLRVKNMYPCIIETTHTHKNIRFQLWVPVLHNAGFFSIILSVLNSICLGQKLSSFTLLTIALWVIFQPKNWTYTSNTVFVAFPFLSSCKTRRIFRIHLLMINSEIWCWWTV